MVDRLVPADLLPWVGDVFANHRLGDAVLVSGIAPSKTTFHTRVAFVGFAIFPRHHAHHRIAFHFGFEAATHAAVSASGDQAVLGLTQFNHRLFLQSGGRTSFHTSAAGHAFAVHEGLVLTGRDTAFKATARDGQRKRALGFFTRADTAIAHNAFAGVVSEVRVRFVFLHVAMVVASLCANAITHIAQTGDAGHVLQFAIAIGTACQAI